VGFGAAAGSADEAPPFVSVACGRSLGRLAPAAFFTSSCSAHIACSLLPKGPHLVVVAGVAAPVRPDARLY
jgi:hypothetical protein